jgi:tryptophanyl-tRNA synthetase
VGLFTYPILQIADILIYQADVVPVGGDQRQHVELTRDLAQRFNTRFGDTFTVPAPYIVKETARIVDLQDPTIKMSKSASSPKGIVDLLDDPKTAAKKIRSAVTDTGTEVKFDEENKAGVSNLLTIHSSFSGTPVTELEERFAGRGYGDFKKETAEVLVDFLIPFQEKVRGYLEDPAELDRVLAVGAAKARAVAAPVLAEAYKKIGFLPPAQHSLPPAGA